VRQKIFCDGKRKKYVLKINEINALKISFGSIVRNCYFFSIFAKALNEIKPIQTMEVTVITQQTWSISKSLLKIFNETNLEKMLSVFNQVGSSNYYLMDYYNQKIILDSPSSLILCGHPKETAEKEGFAFFRKILNEKEFERVNHIDKKIYTFFFNYPESKRNDLIYSYNFKTLTANNREQFLHYKVMPYKLCKNGNVWLSLCHVWASSRKNVEVPTIVNRKTGEQYHFIDGEFTQIASKAVTDEEIVILESLVKDLPDKEIGELLSISVANLKRRKRVLFEKLEVNTSAGAVHKAHLLGII